MKPENAASQILGQLQQSRVSEPRQTILLRHFRAACAALPQKDKAMHIALAQKALAASPNADGPFAKAIAPAETSQRFWFWRLPARCASII